MNQFPCPNPVCPHNFAQAEVQAAGALKCPRCGQVFQFRQGAAPPAASASPSATLARAAASPVPPQAKPVRPVPSNPTPMPPGRSSPPLAAPAPMARPVPAAPPQARPVQAPPQALPAAPTAVPIATAPVASPIQPAAAAPMALPVAGPPSAAAFTAAPPVAADPGHLDEFAAVDTGPVLRVRRHQEGGWTKKNWIILGTCGALLIGAVIVLIALKPFSEGYGKHSGPVNIFVGNVRAQRGDYEKAFKLVLPKDNWSGDNELKTGLSALTAWKHNSYDVWIAVQAADYGTQKPRDAELINEGMEKLQKQFGESLELAPKTEPAKIAKLDAQRLKFRGQINAVVHWGAVYMLTQHGFGYWLYIGGPSLEETDSAIAQLESEGLGFEVHTDRRGWRDQPPPMENFTSASGDLRLLGPQGVYEKVANAKDEDEYADLFLFGRYLKEKDNRKNASVLVLNMKRELDLKEAMKTGKKYIEDKKKEENEMYRLETIGEDDKSGDLGLAQDVGNRRGRVGEFKLSLGDEAKRYVLIGVINDEEKMYVVRCDSTWESRQIWRQDFLDLLGTVKLRKAEKKMDE